MDKRFINKMYDLNW